VAACDRIGRALKTTVVLGHHTPWDPATQRPKGSSRIPDCADAGFLLENKNGALTLTRQKMRDPEQRAPIYLKLTKQDAALVVDTGTRTTDLPTAMLRGERKKALAALKPGMRFSEWEKAYGGNANTVRYEVGQRHKRELVTQDLEKGTWAPMQFNVEHEMRAA
jgi:hypothetical protein